MLGLLGTVCFVGKPQHIIGAYAVIQAKSDQVMDGQCIYAVFIAGIYLLRGFQDLGDICLLQAPVLTKLPYFVAIRFHSESSFLPSMAKINFIIQEMETQCNIIWMHFQMKYTVRTQNTIICWKWHKMESNKIAKK